MRISQRNEYILLAVLIVALATSTGASTLRGLLGTTLGRIIGLGAIIYVWKKISAPASLILLVMYVRYANIVEGMENNQSETTIETKKCTCESGFTWDTKTSTCTNSEGAIKPPTSCECKKDQMWDASKTQCVDKPKPESMPTATTSNATSETFTGTVTNKNTITTPGEAYTLASQKANKQLTSIEHFSPNLEGVKNYATFE